MENKVLLSILIAVVITPLACAQENEKSGPDISPFGEGGQIKMLYDRRQRPPSVYLNGKVYIAFNAGGEKGAPSNSPTKPMVAQFDPISREFSEVVTLGPGTSDHHHGPVIWADVDDYLHTLYGCHSTPGTHLISKQPASIGTTLEDWTIGPQIAPKISYPTIYRILDNKTLIYYRTAGHISSWTYRISDNNGRTWVDPETDVTDLDSKGRFEWSSYQCKLPSEDGRYLYSVFTAYDDNRQSDSARYYNPRYKKKVSNEWKYNLYLVKIDLESGDVYNFEGEKMDTPIDLDQANDRCRIWDTEWRGAGVPPDIVLDENGDPAFLHVLSEATTEQHNYYFVYLAGGVWKKTVIAPSNHQWNSCHINLDREGVYHAYLVTGDQFEKGNNDYLDTGGYMDKHGGGRIVEWISLDKGSTWQMKRDLTPDSTLYPGWRFNNIQPVTNVCGTAVEGMLMFYGWEHPEAPEARGFLLQY